MAYFDKALFRKIVSLSLVINLCWAIAAIYFESLKDSDRGFISGLGFLIVYTIPFFVSLPKQKRQALTLVYFILTSLLIFCVSTFVIGGLLLESSDVTGVVASSVFSAICLTALIRTQYKLFSMPVTIVLFCVAISIAFFVSLLFKKDDYFFWKYGLSIFYFLWQGLTTTVLAFSIAKANSEAIQTEHG